MANYDTWYGPFTLTKESINANVLPSPIGNYLLSISSITSNPQIDYVGRAHDQPVHDRLMDHLNDKLSICESFWVMYKQTKTDTYIQECKDYHFYNPILNDCHPARLNGSNLECPVNGCDQ